MIKWLLKHQWKRWSRSSIWQKSLAINIVIGFIILILFLELLALGLFIDKILIAKYPEENPVVIFNGLLLYYFLIDLILRFLMQTLPAITIESYLHLPISRSKIIHFLLSESIVSIFNFLPLLILIPFALKVIMVSFSPGIALIWLFGLFILILANNFLATYIKRLLIYKPGFFGVFGLALAIIIILEYFHLISLTSFSSIIFSHMMQIPALIIIPIVLLAVLYNINYLYLKARLYPDEVRVRKRTKIDSISKIKYFDTLGNLGELVSLELKLLWRNKRPKSVLPFVPVFMLYGLITYPTAYYEEFFGMLIFIGIFITGGFMIIYGQFLLCWESTYFDVILSNNIDFHKYFKVKFLIILFITLISYLITLPYAFFGLKILFINTTAFLFNIGIMSFLLLFIANNNKKRIDLSKKAFLNYQGFGTSQWVVMVIFFLLPVLIYLPFGFLDIPYIGIAIIGLLGITGLIFYQSLLNIIVKRFEKKKYKIAEGFRQP